MGIITNAAVLVALFSVCCYARLAEKVSEDENFVVYRIPVKTIDLLPQETGYYDGSYGRSSSKTSSQSSSQSSSTGTGKGRGIGGGSSGEGHGYGTGGSGTGHGHGGNHGGYGGGGGVGGSPHYSSGPQYRQSAGSYNSGAYDTNTYDSDYDGPKIYTTTKTYTTTQQGNSGTDPVGDVNFRLADYLKESPGQDFGGRYSQKLYEGFGAGDFMRGPKVSFTGDYGSRGFSEANFRGTPTYTLGDLTKGLHSASFGSYGSPSVVYPRAYALRHAGFGLGY